VGAGGIGIALGVVSLAGFLVLLGATRLSVGHTPATLIASTPPFRGAELLAVSFVLGTGSVSLQMFLYSLARIRFHFLSIALPWVAVAALWAVVPNAKHNAAAIFGHDTDPASAPLSTVDLCSATVVSLQIAYVFFYALSFPIAGWDAWVTWLMKARAFFLSGEVSASFLRDPLFPVPDYPLHMPLAVAWLYIAAGSVQDQWSKVVYPLQFSSLLLVFNGLARIMTSRRNALFFTAMLSGIPIVIVHGGGLPTGEPKFGLNTWDDVGYADLALSLCFLLSGGLLAVGFRHRLPTCFYWAALFLGLGAWTKNEGLSFALFGVVAILWAARLRILGNRDLIPIAGVILLFVVPWMVYKSHLQIGSEYFDNLSAHVTVDALNRLPIIASSVGARLLKITGPYNLLFYLYVVAVLLNVRRLASSPALLVHALLALQMTAYIAIYTISPHDLRWQLSTSMARLMLHLVPLALLATSIHTFEWVTRASSRLHAEPPAIA
jgi:uncharacterized membrane protein (UPF0136 family)